ncbi:MAG: SH3 domain-containing protein [Anaerolineaceae bacterium]|nr:SH3 domain-containing protein [Anaerolineaceae bacterium]
MMTRLFRPFPRLYLIVPCVVVVGILLAVPPAALSQNGGRDAIIPANAADLAIVDRLEGRNQGGLAWSPQGSLLAAAGPEGVMLYEWTAEGRQLVRELATRIPLADVAWSSDGSLLIASKQDGDLTWLWDAGSGDLAATYQIGGVLGFVLDDTLIALRTNTGLDLWGIPGGSAITPANAYRLQYVASINSAAPNAGDTAPWLALSPDGRWVAFATQPVFDRSAYTVELWDIAGHSRVWSADFDPEQQAGRGYTRNRKTLAFTPDSAHLAVHQGNAIRLLNTADGGEAAILENDPTDLSGQYMAFSPDGSVLAVSTVVSDAEGKSDFTLELWDVRQETVIGQLDVRSIIYKNLAFSADGTLLAGIYPYVPYNTVLFGVGAPVTNLDKLLTPTPTITPIPPTPVPTEPPVLHIGGTALIQTTGGDPLNMRGGPGRSFDIVARLPAGVTVTILDGPREADGYRWWQIRTTNAVEGWVVDEVDDLQTLLPQS